MREEAQAALIADVFSVLARPGVGPGEVHGAGRAAAEAGLVAEASACRAVGELLEREERTQLAHEASSNEARKRAARRRAEAQTAREARAHADEKHRRQQYADELAGVGAALAREEEVRRKIEAANVARSFARRRGALGGRAQVPAGGGALDRAERQSGEWRRRCRRGLRRRRHAG